MSKGCGVGVVAPTAALIPGMAPDMAPDMAPLDTAPLDGPMLVAPGEAPLDGTVLADGPALAPTDATRDFEFGASLAPTDAGVPLPVDATDPVAVDPIQGPLLTTDVQSPEPAAVPVDAGLGVDDGGIEDFDDSASDETTPEASTIDGDVDGATGLSAALMTAALMFATVCLLA